MTEREKFEKHMKMLGFIDMHYSRSGGGSSAEGYSNQYVHYAWAAWQARAAQDEWISVETGLPKKDAKGHCYIYRPETQEWKGCKVQIVPASTVRFMADITMWKPVELPEGPKS